MTTRTKSLDPDENRDPITDEPERTSGRRWYWCRSGRRGRRSSGRMAAGPVGTVAGAVVGGVAGGLAGKAVAEQIDPSVEEHHWRNEYPQPRLLRSNDRLRRSWPRISIRLGVAGRIRRSQVGRGRARFGPRMDNAPRQVVARLGPCRPATRDAWERVDTNFRKNPNEATYPDPMEDRGEAMPRMPK